MAAFSLSTGIVPTTSHSTDTGVPGILHDRFEKIRRGCTAVTRGKKPEAAITEAKSFAERMGYRWTDNPHAAFAFWIGITLLLYKE